jgi:hypothetical protein
VRREEARAAPAAAPAAPASQWRGRVEDEEVLAVEVLALPASVAKAAAGRTVCEMGWGWVFERAGGREGFRGEGEEERREVSLEVGCFARSVGCVTTGSRTLGG